MQIKECKHCGKKFETYNLNKMFIGFVKIDNNIPIYCEAQQPRASQPAGGVERPWSGTPSRWAAALAADQKIGGVLPLSFVSCTTLPQPRIK